MLRVIGLMSGTSLDGIDVALIETDGITIHHLGPSGCAPYTPDERVLLRKALDEASVLRDRSIRPGVVAEAEDLVTSCHIRALENFLSSHQCGRNNIDLIGFHGQTILHRPEIKLTIQIGEGQRLADRTGIPVVSDFRAADIAAGGQGAPLVPLFHQALAKSAGLEGPLAVLNIGGVANITYLSLEENEPPIACDVGPGNALLDDFMLKRTGMPIDYNGFHAAKGKAHEGILKKLMEHPFFTQPLPKSLDRNAFTLPDFSGLSVEDGAATLTEFSARAVARIVPLLPCPPQLLILCGGGSYNAELVRRININTGARVIIADELGWSANAIEAQAFAYLAARSLKGLPLTLPTTTGVVMPTAGGLLSRPNINKTH